MRLKVEVTSDIKHVSAFIDCLAVAGINSAVLPQKEDGVLFYYIDVSDPEQAYCIGFLYGQWLNEFNKK